MKPDSTTNPAKGKPGKTRGKSDKIPSGELNKGSTEGCEGRDKVEIGREGLRRREKSEEVRRVEVERRDWERSPFLSA